MVSLTEALHLDMQAAYVPALVCLHETATPYTPTSRGLSLPVLPPPVG